MSVLPVYSAENRDTPSAFAGLLLHSSALGQSPAVLTGPGRTGVCVCGGGSVLREQILTRFGFLHCEYFILGTAVILKWQSIKVKGTVTSLTHPRGKPAQLVTVDSPGQKRDKCSKCRRKGNCRCEGYGGVGGALGLIPGQ